MWIKPLTVEICNRALIRLGEDTITSLDDDSDRARICNALYPEVLQTLLSSYPWNCAVHRAELAQLVDAPVWNYAYCYQLPTDPYCLRVLEADVDITNYPWEVEGRTLVTDANTIKIKYLALLTDENAIPPFLRKLAAIMLAAEICYPITGDPKMALSIWELYGREEKEARLIDGQEGTPRRIDSTDLTSVRL
ncbi:MAG: hypothetical protein ACYTFW_19740 [Planctomycetota bacterium]